MRETYHQRIIRQPNKVHVSNYDVYYEVAKTEGEVSSAGTSLEPFQYQP